VCTYLFAKAEACTFSTQSISALLKDETIECAHAAETWVRRIHDDVDVKARYILPDQSNCGEFTLVWFGLCRLIFKLTKLIETSQGRNLVRFDDICATIRHSVSPKFPFIQSLFEVITDLLMIFACFLKAIIT
jgi:hypothetical protein